MLWALLSLFFPVYIVPSPFAVLGKTPHFLRQGIFSHLTITIFRVLIGFFCAFLIGTITGVLSILINKSLYLNAFMALIQVIPGTILGIIFLLVFGVGNCVPIALVVVLVLPLIAINTSNSLANRNEKMEQYLVSIGGRRRDLYHHVFLPLLIPAFQSNLTIGFGISLKVVILGEFIGSQSGIGYLLNVSKIYFRMDEVFFHLSVIIAIMICFQITQSFLFSVLGKKYFYPN